MGLQAAPGRPGSSGSVKVTSMQVVIGLVEELFGVEPYATWNGGLNTCFDCSTTTPADRVRTEWMSFRVDL